MAFSHLSSVGIQSSDLAFLALQLESPQILLLLFLRGLWAWPQTPPLAADTKVEP